MEIDPRVRAFAKRLTVTLSQKVIKWTTYNMKLWMHTEKVNYHIDWYIQMSTWKETMQFIKWLQYTSPSSILCTNLDLHGNFHSTNFKLPYIVVCHMQALFVHWVCVAASHNIITKIPDIVEVPASKLMKVAVIGPVDVHVHIIIKTVSIIILKKSDA